MKNYFIDFNPMWGTRFQNSGRHLFGPFSTKKGARRVREQICQQMQWPADTPCAMVTCQEVDRAETIQVGSGPYTTLRTDPLRDI